MSYALRIVGDVLSDLRQLDTRLQEEVLDELELFAAQPRLLKTDPRGLAVHDFERQTANGPYVVFLRLHRDDSLHLLTVVAVRALPWPALDGA